MAGHSATPLATKLGIRPGDTVALLHAPDDLALELPDGVTVRHRASRRPDLVVEFTTSAGELDRRIDRRIDRLASMVQPAGALWIASPKKSSGVATDVTDHTVPDLALPRGLVDDKVCAIDITWTALRVVWRLVNR